MGQKEYVDRVKSDYRKTFSTPAGRHVLMDMYTHWGGNKTSMPHDADPIRMAFNEGMRFAWLRVMEHLNDGDIEMRKLLQEHFNERAREESS